MRFKTKRIFLDNLQLYPSDVYSATISGVFDFDKNVSLSDTVMDGSVYGFSKINAKHVTLNIFTKKRNDIQNYLKINNLLAKKKNMIYVEYEYLGLIQSEVVLTSKTTSNDFGGAISVVFTAPDPYFYTEVDTINLGVDFGEGLKFPITFPFSFDGVVTGQYGKLENKGSVDAYPVITINGSCTNFTLTNKTTGQTNIFERTLESNDVLKIDCRPNSLGIYLNGVRETNQNIIFYTCPSGWNEFEFTRDTPAETVRNCKIELQSRIL